MHFVAGHFVTSNEAFANGNRLRRDASPERAAMGESPFGCFFVLVRRQAA
jgi:hypothetical protein